MYDCVDGRFVTSVCLEIALYDRLLLQQLLQRVVSCEAGWEVLRGEPVCVRVCVWLSVCGRVCV